mmetsp:Transcript_14337/g.19925  ORF Transcript_14337/g.19925 Transcript_14337/m.19925 type:complete len:86 (-) Transcript_14337:166-423(-)
MRWAPSKLDAAISRLFRDSEIIGEKAFMDCIGEDGTLMKLFLRDISDFLTSPSSQSYKDCDKGLQNAKRSKSVKTAWSETDKKID